MPDSDCHNGGGSCSSDSEASPVAILMGRHRTMADPKSQSNAAMESNSDSGDSEYEEEEIQYGILHVGEYKYKPWFSRSVKVLEYKCAMALYRYIEETIFTEGDWKIEDARASTDKCGFILDSSGALKLVDPPQDLASAKGIFDKFCMDSYTYDWRQGTVALLEDREEDAGSEDELESDEEYGDDNESSVSI